MKELGATHVVNTNDSSVKDTVLQLTGGHGPDIMIGASAVPDLVEIGYEITRPKGKYVQGGIPPPGYEKEFGVAERSMCAWK